MCGCTTLSNQILPSADRPGESLRLREKAIADFFILSPSAFSMAPLFLNYEETEPVTRADVTVQLSSLSPENPSQGRQLPIPGMSRVPNSIGRSRLLKDLWRDLPSFSSLSEQPCPEFPKSAVLQGRSD